VLPAAARLTDSREFRLITRKGRRAGRSRLVVHTLPGAAKTPTHAGFVVSKAVGNSVVRHRVTRRLRHVIAPTLAQLPAGTALVVRALPPAANAPSSELESDVLSALRRLRLLPGAGDAP
jgi:ribonuclease P protein component